MSSVPEWYFRRNRFVKTKRKDWLLLTLHTQTGVSRPFPRRACLGFTDNGCFICWETQDLINILEAGKIKSQLLSGVEKLPFGNCHWVPAGVANWIKGVLLTCDYQTILNLHFYHWIFKLWCSLSMSRTQLKTFVELLDFFWGRVFHVLFVFVKKKRKKKKKEKRTKNSHEKTTPKSDNKTKQNCAFYLSLIRSWQLFKESNKDSRFVLRFRVCGGTAEFFWSRVCVVLTLFCLILNHASDWDAFEEGASVRPVTSVALCATLYSAVCLGSWWAIRRIWLNIGLG